MQQDSIAASFGGRPATLKIHRQDMELFEVISGVSAYALFTKFTRGEWTVEDIKAVLKFALLPASRLAEIRQARRAILATSGRSYMPSLFKECGPHVDATLHNYAPGKYAPLAMTALAAALFGIDAEEATFDDEVPIGAGQ